MSYEVKELTGSMFYQQEKQNPKAPDFRGNIKINGVTYNLAGWNRYSQNGKSYISLVAELPQQRNQQQPYPAPQQQYPQPQNPQQGYQQQPYPQYPQPQAQPSSPYPQPQAQPQPQPSENKDDLPFGN